jgi:Flp pilus assembly protein TadD
MIYANYLARRKRSEEARRQYGEALKLAPNDPEVNYNAGLFFVDQGDLARAKVHAEVAYAGGYPLPGLRNKIAAAETTD